MQLEVMTAAGPVRGRERRGVGLFAGIPYAAPPVGERRWKPPAPAEAWTEVRDCTRFGPAAPQLPGDGLTNAAPIDWDEDCLTLNVCTPAADDAGRPVMVWIHGGAYRHGTGATPWYDGTSFALNGDIVVVSINYRLGALGFCRMPGESTAGINGTLDQLAALRWVRDNIAAFGGDPAQVTIAGESAGGFSVATLLAMEGAAGLFRGAIPQSGAGHHVLDDESADTVSQIFLEELGVDGVDAAREIGALGVLEAQARVEGRAGTHIGRVTQPFYPSVDSQHLPARPVELLARGAGADVAVLTGTNADETTLFGMGQIPEDKLAQLMRHYVDPPEALIAEYRAAHPEADASEISVMLTTDYSFRIPAVRLAEARAAHDAATWMYLFDWKSQAFGGALGATHALEIPFTFATLDRPGVEIFLGTEDLPWHVSRTMHDAWISFIRTGSPVTEALGEWRPYHPDDRAVMRFADDHSLLVDPGSSVREAWSGHR
ncbi:MAG: carboxylesterase/lipase family protein [Actinomycetota bacterium]